MKQILIALAVASLIPCSAARARVDDKRNDQSSYAKQPLETAWYRDEMERDAGKQQDEMERDIGKQQDEMERGIGKPQEELEREEWKEQNKTQRDERACSNKELRAPQQNDQGKNNGSQAND